MKLFCETQRLQKLEVQGLSRESWVNLEVLDCKPKLQSLIDSVEKKFVTDWLIARRWKFEWKLDTKFFFSPFVQSQKAFETFVYLIV